MLEKPRSPLFSLRSFYTHRCKSKVHDLAKPGAQRRERDFLAALGRSVSCVTFPRGRLGTSQDRTVQKLAGHANEIVGACFLSPEQLVATISKVAEIVLWVIDAGEQLVKFQANFSRKLGREACLAFSYDGRTLVAAGDVIVDPTRKVTWKVP